MTYAETKSSWYLKCLFAFVITLGAFSMKFPHYVSKPNTQSFVSNGDLYITLYDMIYFIKYDEGGRLSAFNYPDGEFIFMTDANGSFALVMRWIHHNVIDIGSIIPGILFTFIYLCIGLCGTFLFIILRTWGVSTMLAMILAPLITWLSPQMARLPAHLSLTYPFVIPMVILWCMRKYKRPYLEVWDGVFAFVTFFFFMNNAYVGFIMCMLAGAIGFFVYIGNRKDRSSVISSVIMMATPVLITILVFVILKINDPFDDRLKEQWGFFHYHTRLSSLFYPKWSLIASFIEKYKVNDGRSIEWTNNLGIVPMLLIISLGIYNLIKRKKSNWRPLLEKDKFLKAMFWAVFCMFLFAANTAIFPIKDLIESYMDHLLMFKSSGRFSWPLYFFAGIVGAKILQSWMDRLKPLHGIAPYLLLVPLIALYGYETNHFLTTRFNDRDRPNYLTSPEIDPFVADFEKYGINKETYQAIYVLPLLQGWNEKTVADVYVRSERGALITSSLTGIPMINSRLSRNSTGATLRTTQISSHPYIVKEALHKLPSDKPILLVEGKEAEKKLSDGEKHLKSLAKQVYEGDKFVLYALDLNEVFKYEELKKAKIYLDQVKDSLHLTPQPLYYESFDDQEDSLSFVGKGSLMIHKGETMLLDTVFQFDEAQELEFYSWNEVTHEKYGMPVYTLTATGSDGKLVKKEFQCRESKEIYKNWLRGFHTIKVPSGKVNFKISVKTNQSQRIDEMSLARWATKSIHHVPGSNIYLMRGIPVVLE